MQAPLAPISLVRVVRLPQVCELTGLSRSMIYQLEANERFPRRVKLSERAVGWVESEVQKWISDRMNERPKDKKSREP